jgi:deoxyribonuclease V
MKIKQLHSWDVTPREAREIQESLSAGVIRSWRKGGVKTVAGTDISFPSRDEVLAAAVVLTYPELEVIETEVRRGPNTFPYVPGLLSFREAPMLAEVLGSITAEPDVILCDGQGLAHPRGMGLACHVGLLTDRATVGCAKSRLYGEFDPPGEAKGEWSPLVGKEGDTVGAVLRTRTGVSPVFVSIGHRITLEAAVDIVLECSPKYRIPEPLRLAHRLAAGLAV